MDKAPPATGSRIQELGDLLVVYFRLRRSWGTLGFLAFWLTLWTAGGIAALTQRRFGVLPQIVFPLLVVGAIASLAVWALRDSHREAAPPAVPADASPRGPVLPPTEDQFGSMRVLASATTFQTLVSAKTTVLSQPACRPHPTWREWTCTVTARPTLPRLAGRTLRYRCSAVSTPSPVGGRAGRGVICGPDPPPTLGGCEWSQPGSNRRPSGCHPDALPAELWPLARPV